MYVDSHPVVRQLGPLDPGPRLVEQVVAHRVRLVAVVLRDQLPRRRPVGRAGRPCSAQKLSKTVRDLGRPVARRERHLQVRRQRERHRSLRRVGRHALAAVLLVPLSWCMSNSIQIFLSASSLVTRSTRLKYAGSATPGLLRRDTGPQHPEARAVEAVLRQATPRPCAVKPAARVRRCVRRPLPDQVEPVDDHHAAVLVDQEPPLPVQPRCRVSRRRQRARRSRHATTRAASSSGELLHGKLERVLVARVTRRRPCPGWGSNPH